MLVQSLSLEDPWWRVWQPTPVFLAFPSGSDGKENACNAGDLRDTGLIPGSGRSSGKGHGNLLQYSCLENSMDRRTWHATVHGVAESHMTGYSEFMNTI